MGRETTELTCVSAVTNSPAGKYKSIHMENRGREERRRRIRCSSALHLRYTSLSRGCNPAYFHICRYITCPACINTSDLQYRWEKPVMHRHPPQGRRIHTSQREIWWEMMKGIYSLKNKYSEQLMLEDCKLVSIPRPTHTHLFTVNIYIFKYTTLYCCMHNVWNVSLRRKKHECSMCEVWILEIIKTNSTESWRKLSWTQCPATTSTYNKTSRVFWHMQEGEKMGTSFCKRSCPG